MADEEQIGGEELLFGAIFFWNAFNTWPWGGLCPSGLWNGWSGPFLGVVWEGLSGRGKEMTDWVSLVPGFAWT